ncbi:MAG: IPTL-CTERM sorting domain-containing protein [Thermodesulfobacteriota bacterium]
MIRIISTFIISLVVVLLFQQESHSVCPPPVGSTTTCTDNQPNPDLNGVDETGNPSNVTVIMLPGSAIDTRLSSGGSGEEGIAGGDAMNTITLNDARIDSENESIETETGDDVVNITDSELMNLNVNTVELGGGSNILNITRSSIINANGRVLSMTPGNDQADNVTIIDSEVKTLISSSALETGSSSDNVFIENSIIQGGSNINAVPEVIDLGSNDDVLRLSTGADIRGVTNNGINFGNGFIDCGADFDTIIFEMRVATNQLEAITAEIESKNPAEDQITINNLTYIWIDCEELVADVRGGFTTAVPTLSEWGLIAMAGVLGLIGFAVIRRRQAAA